MNEFNIIGCEPKETLIKCLNDCSIDNLKAIGVFYNIKFNNKNEYINYLKEEIIKKFKDTVTDLPYYIYKELKNDKNNFLVSLIKYGFMFHYHKENNDCINVIPKEIKDIFNNYIKEHNNDYLYILTKRTILYYLTINNYIPKDILEKIILSYIELNATKETFNKAIKELGIITYKNNYTAFSLDNVKKMESKKYDISYNIIDLYELSFYDDLLWDLIHTIYYIVNVKENDEEKKEQIIIELLKYDHNNEEFIDFLKKQYHIDEKQKNKIEMLLNESTNKIKYWNLKGRTYDEYISEIFLENGILNELPKKTDILSCLENLNEDGYKLIKTYLSFNGDSKEKLKEEILKNIDDLINCYPKEYLAKLLEYNNNNYDKFIKGNLLINGIVYLYLDDDIKVLIPDEVIEYLNNSTQEKLNVTNIINIYIKNNGVIDIDILVKLINDNHNLNINKEDIFEYSKTYKVPIIDNKYISFFANLPKSYIEQLLLLKNTYKKYKKLDINIDYTQDFLDVTDTITDNLSELDKSIIASSFIFPLLNGAYDKLILKERLKQKNLLKYYNSLDIIASKFKNKIGIWSLNGYTLKDNISVSKKVGRNDPCPCGSGKKFKKCCGK